MRFFLDLDLGLWLDLDPNVFIGFGTGCLAGLDMDPGVSHVRI